MRKISDVLKEYGLELDDQEIGKTVKNLIESDFETHYSLENLKKCFSLIDLTSLNSADTQAKIESLVERVNGFSQNFNMPNVAAICVYPNLVSTVKKNLKAKGVKIASVAGVFPSAQSFIEVKELECRMAVEKGADEIDVVISIGAFLGGNLQTVFDEIKAQKQACGKAHLKVILETGELKTASNIRTASLLAMEAGADFIKTSTGKVPVNATLEAAYVMTKAINGFYQKTGRMVGFKPAGGISTAKDAVEYYTIVHHNLGEKWLNNTCLRIGASSLANNLLAEILRKEGKRDVVAKYF